MENRFQALKGQFEYLNGRRYLKIEADSSGLAEYQIKILETESCPALLPLSRIRSGTVDWLYYDVTAFENLAEALLARAGQPGSAALWLMQLLSRVVSALNLAELHLLPADNFSLQPETIYYRQHDEAIRLILLPGRSVTGTTDDHLAELLKWLIQMSGEDEFEAYAEDLLLQMEAQNPGLVGIQKRIDEKMRRMHLIRWPAVEIGRQPVEKSDQV
ncbi:MAG TPA: hypothetical protein GX726_00710 [Clostridiales bacterium]|nr:hypothetical protein [Clostridiales bacterium]